MPDHPYPTRKKIRLNPQLYADETAVCSVTICTLDRAPLFRDATFADACVQLLASQAESSGIRLFAYCLMPDHMHILAGPSANKSIIDFVREFKGMSTRLSWEYGHSGMIWQPRYFDHFLRRDEDVERAAEYILNNPVRMGMVADWHQYSFSGSLVYEL